jgi:hypothetical protein
MEQGPILLTTPLGGSPPQATLAQQSHHEAMEIHART